MLKNKYWRLIVVLWLVVGVVLVVNRPWSFQSYENKAVLKGEIMATHVKEIYLAGGCFWGVEAYFSRLEGVLEATSGYANGKVDQTRYELLAQTDHAETVRVVYNPEQIPLQNLLKHYFRLIDPTSINQQGNDRGRQYRTGIYTVDEADDPVVAQALSDLARRYDKPLQVEHEPLAHFIMAEDYHQDYLTKNPNGYCHINLAMADEPLTDD